MTNEAGLEFEDKMTDKKKEALGAFNHWLFTWQTDPEVNKHVKTIRAALSSPRVPVIEGLDSIIQEGRTWYGVAGSIDPVAVPMKDFDKLMQAARAYAALPKMQKVDLERKTFLFDDGRPDAVRSDEYNAALDDIKSKYGELYAEVK